METYDPGAVIAIVLTALTTITCNLMFGEAPGSLPDMPLAAYGVWRKRLAWIIPFLTLYAGFIIECALLIVLIVIGRSFRYIASGPVSRCILLWPWSPKLGQAP